ncbi:MAG: hypothetical protein MJ132_06090 [Clostridia bacterium]|nr:hypothetical protein [Clostridia bacterium]
MDAVKTRLLSSKEFSSEIDDHKFKLKENLVFHNGALHPTIYGEIFEQSDFSIIKVTFKLSKTDRIALSVFWGIFLCISLLYLLFYRDLIGSLGIFLATCFLGIIIALVYLIIIYKIYFKLKHTLK